MIPYRRFRTFLPTITLALFVAVSPILALPPRALASVSVKIEPSLVELTGDAGAEGVQEITVSNQGDEPFALDVQVESYQNALDEWSATAWMTVEPARVELEAGSSATVSVSFAIPKDIESGGRYARVSFTTVPAGSEGNVSAIAGKLSTVFLIDVEGKGDLDREASLDWFGPVLEPDGRVGFRAVVSNTGNTHLLPAGSVSLIDNDGSELALLEVPRPTPLLPERQTIMAATGTLPLPPNEHFNAKLTLETGADQPLESEQAFAVDAAMSIAGVYICENLDRGPTVVVSLTNEGALGLFPIVLASLEGETGQGVVAKSGPEPLLLQTGAMLELPIETVERLPSGSYSVSIRADFAMPAPDGASALEPLTAETSFTIGGLGSDAIPLCAPAS